MMTGELLLRMIMIMSCHYDYDYKGPVRLEIGDEREERFKEDWPNNDVGTVNDYDNIIWVLSEKGVIRKEADQVKQEENQPETTTRPAEGEKREYLKKWNYKPILPSLPTTPRKVLGLITYTPIVNVKKESKDKTLSLSDDIFINWGKPGVTAPPEEDLENDEIKKTKNQLPASLNPVPKIQRRRKRKKNTPRKLFAKKT